jgi:hypothetical protein
VADDIRVRWLLRDADHADKWARQLRTEQQHHLDRAADLDRQATEAETRAAGLRTQAAELADTTT